MKEHLSILLHTAEQIKFVKQNLMVCIELNIKVSSGLFSLFRVPKIHVSLGNEEKIIADKATTRPNKKGLDHNPPNLPL